MTTIITDLVSPEAIKQMDELINKLSIAVKLNEQLDKGILKIQALTQLLNVEHLKPELRASAQNKLSELVANI